LPSSDQITYPPQIYQPFMDKIQLASTLVIVATAVVGVAMLIQLVLAANCFKCIDWERGAPRMSLLTMTLNVVAGGLGIAGYELGLDAYGSNWNHATLPSFFQGLPGAPIPLPQYTKSGGATYALLGGIACLCIAVVQVSLQYMRRKSNKWDLTKLYMTAHVRSQAAAPNQTQRKTIEMVNSPAYGANDPAPIFSPPNTQRFMQDQHQSNNFQ